MDPPSAVRRDTPAEYTVPPFPSLFWPPQSSAIILYELDEMWKFTLFWTLILYGLFHLGAVGVAVLMHGGKRISNWKYLWLVPLVYFLIAGFEALIAGTLVGLIVGATYLVGGFAMSTWIPFIWGWALNPGPLPALSPVALPRCSVQSQNSPTMERQARPRPWSSDRWSPNNSTPTPSYSTPHDIIPYLPHQPKSLSGIALRAFCLGAALTASLFTSAATLLFTSSSLWRLPFFIAALSLFHFLEFWTTAAFNTPDADVAAFLLTSNWPEYAIAHTVAMIECLVTHILWRNKHGFGFYVTAIGLVLVVAGQIIRSLAMAHAGRSFSHYVQRQRRPGHELVTTGVYSVLRHPSYFGFFWWAIGTQLVMGNVFSLAGYAAVLSRFFRRRVREEEKFLVGFFGEDYEAYRKRVRVGIPFVS
ncbi:hypothetical protein VTJ49DRAFT_1748 [Mycothermus thermophilus]|uniref:Protein-S-isoprenylcysteine O-methyltransferase n=1 Tax=Humicola insolens TaxID=85995 RepID=A0ABR3VND1_HUMIN